MKYFFVVNPNSRNGQTKKIWPEIERKLRKYQLNFAFKFTEKPLDAIDISLSATFNGYDVIVSVGGDGTNNEVLNGIMKANLTPDKRPYLGFIPQGTGGDFKRSINLTSDIDKSIEVLTKVNSRKIDIGKISFLNHQKIPTERYFLNICSFGISGLVDYYVNHTTKLFGGKISFMIGTLRGLLKYKNISASIVVDGKDFGEMNITLVAVANGKYFGGSMMVAPDAEIDDGLFDVIVMKDISTLKFLLNGLKIYKGQHIIPPNVFSLKAENLYIEKEGLYIDLDGEDAGMTPAKFNIIPRAINILTP